MMCCLVCRIGLVISSDGPIIVGGSNVRLIGGRDPVSGRASRDTETDLGRCTKNDGVDV